MSKTRAEQPAKTADDSYWNKVRDFNLARTSFWVLVLWQLIETIIPFVLVWIFVGADFKNNGFNHYDDLASPQAGFLALIGVGILLWAWAIQTLTFFWKWQKADSFTFTLIFSLILFALVMNGCWLVDSKLNSGIRVMLRFLICLAVGIAALFLGVLISAFARNYRYKTEEDDEALLIAYQNGEPVPTKDQLRLVRAQKAHQQRAAETAELDAFKTELDQKLITAFNEKKAVQREEKLNQKEAKQRARYEKRSRQKPKRVD